MKNQTTLSQLVLGVALVTVLLLMIPFVAMQFTGEVNWSAADFVLMGALLFGTGTSFVLITRFRTNLVYRIAMGMAIGTTLFMIWANLGVGLIGSGPNLGNLMYMGVLAVVFIGSLRSRFSSVGMEHVMYLTALSLVLLAGIALIANMDEYRGSSVNEILAVNGFFALLYAVSGSLFRYAAHEQSTEKSEG